MELEWEKSSKVKNDIQDFSLSKGWMELTFKEIMEGAGLEGRLSQVCLGDVLSFVCLLDV